MPNINLSILNQKATPAFFADTLANRPAPSFVGRIFISTDTYDLYRDTGSAWVLLSPSSTGTITGSGAAGQVTYFNGTSSITGSNDLFWDNVNGHFGISTNVPGTALDVHHDQPTIAILNQTIATNDSRLGFQNNGVGLWRIGAFYNAGANDFGIYDAVAAIQPVTVKKTTGQVLIGTSNVGTGKLVVASSTGDNGVQIVGATSPSLRIDNAEIGATKRIGIGLATAVNNFIQNSQNLDMCIFNSSTSAAGNMLFGIYDTGLANTQEAARISAARNFLIGTIVDAGQKLQVSGTAYISGNTSIGSTSNTYILQTSADGIAGQIQFDQYGTAGANILLRNAKGTAAAPTATQTGDLLGSIGVRGYDGTNFSGGGRSGMYMYAAENFTPTNQGSFIVFGTTPNGTASRLERIRLNDNGNLLIGTTTDNSQKLQVNGTSYLNGNVGIGISTASYNLDVSGGGIFRGGVHTSGSFINGIRIGYDTTNNYSFLESVQVDATARPLRVNQFGGETTFGGNVLIGTTTNGGSKLRIVGLPTSAAGLSSGDIYSNLGVLTIVP